jgi:uncharacterized protein YyaL (SSP411 family)
MEAYKSLGDNECLAMAEKTLMSMAKGGIFDHIGFGFSRYSTDEKWLAPHFEKMLYDNALLIMAYARAYELTRKPIYKTVAEKTMLYVEREMTHPEGGFYSAQDADSDGIEGKYYVFTPQEIISVLGETDGQAFCEMYDITDEGNFEGKNIPNKIGSPVLFDRMFSMLPQLYDYRKVRTTLHKDDKILTSWNALMIAAFADASVVFENKLYLETARRAERFIATYLCEEDRVFTAYREGKKTGGGIICDYAFYINALLRLHYAAPGEQYLIRAEALMQKTIAEFSDDINGGFYLTGNRAEVLISRPKETYDGAIPSGNSLMTMNLVDLNLLTGEYSAILDEQVDFMLRQAADIPGGHAFFLYGLLKKDYAIRKNSDFICSPDSGCCLR